MPRGNTIEVNFGLNNTMSKSFPEGTTVADLLSNTSLKAGLGFGDNVVAKVGGVTQSNGYELQHGDVVDLEVRANTKA